MPKKMINQGFVTKGGDERALPLTGDTESILKRKNAERTNEQDDYVFKGVRGNRLHGPFVSRRFKRYVRLAKLPENINFHALRHTFASWLVQRGVALPIVQVVLGHSSINVTQRYAHLAPDVVEAAIKSAMGRGLKETVSLIDVLA